jgi:PAP2 superfamily
MATLMRHALIAALLALCATLAAAQPKPPSAAVATEWFRAVLPAIQQTPGQSPPVAARTLAYLGIGLHEAAREQGSTVRSLAGQLSELESLPPTQPDETLHTPTVVNATLAALTRMLLPNAPADWMQRFDALERNMPLQDSADFDPAARTPEIILRSETHGRLLAMAIMTWARTDGGHDAGGARRARLDAAYLPPSGPGAWVPTPPRFQRPLLPYWGDNRAFLRDIAARCQPPGPPAFDETPGSPFERETREVLQAARNPSEAQRRAALYWADEPGKTPTPAGHWAWILTDLLRDRNATLAQAADAYARLNIAMSDAFVASWKAKYLFNLLRPVTYLQVTADPLWLPPLMETPPFPEYPSGHSVQSAAAAAVLEALFGANTAFDDRAHNDRGWGPRRFESFRAAADEAGLSRLYAGIHFRSGVEHGAAQGRCIGAAVLALRLR